MIKSDYTTVQVLVLSSNVNTQSTTILAIYALVQLSHLTVLMVNGHFKKMCHTFYISHKEIHILFATGEL